MKKIRMDKKNPKWDAFIDLLNDKVDFRKRDDGETTWTCDGTLVETENILAEHFPEVDLPSSIRYLQEHGGYCDCEVIMNVVDGVLRATGRL